MCDTLLLQAQGQRIFAKNSDRDPNEAQCIAWHPARDHAPGEMLECTYLAIPQAPHTCAVVLSRPFWMWGAEMGANEHGVVIGNEAVFTRQPYASTGLTGMDLLRIALERAASASHAWEIIVEMLQRHGQGGGCGHENRSFTYHNSFLIADRTTAFVLETAGKEYAVEAVQHSHSVSNGLTVPAFRKAHASRLHEWASSCRMRQGRTHALLQAASSTADIMGILRDYGEARIAPRYSWVNGGMSSVCMHAGGLLAASQTTASWITDFAQPDLHWVTATALPSLSLFKPIRVGTPAEVGLPPTDHADSHSLWWKHERLCRRVFAKPDALFFDIQAERDAVEAEWLKSPPETGHAFAVHHALLDKWLQRSQTLEHKDVRPWYVRRYWRTRNAAAGMQELG